MFLNRFCMYSESEGGVSISIKPPIMKSAAVNFQLKKLTCLITRSIIAFKGIPSKVPIEIKRGKV